MAVSNKVANLSVESTPCPPWFCRLLPCNCPVENSSPLPGGAAGIDQEWCRGCASPRRSMRVLLQQTIPVNSMGVRVTRPARGGCLLSETGSDCRVMLEAHKTGVGLVIVV